MTDDAHHYAAGAEIVRPIQDEEEATKRLAARIVDECADYVDGAGFDSVPADDPDAILARAGRMGPPRRGGVAEAQP